MRDVKHLIHHTSAARAPMERIFGLHMGVSATCSSYGGYRLVRGNRMLSITIVAFAMARAKTKSQASDNKELVY